MEIIVIPIYPILNKMSQTDLQEMEIVLFILNIIA